ncbi:MAG: hypothetical protein ACI8ZM_003578 [Crocinitomix sp.]|jgi:hypothetical protein
MKNIGVFILLIAVSFSVNTIHSLPWWSFVVPIFLLGLILPLAKWNVHAFIWSFFAGAVVWVSATLYFENIYKGEIILTISEIIEMPLLVLYIAIGLMGGILTGLAFYAGFLLRTGPEILELGLPEE